MNMVNFVLMEEVDETIPKAKRTPGSDYSSSYDEEIILEGLQVDASRISQIPMRGDEIRVLVCRYKWKSHLTIVLKL